MTDWAVNCAWGHQAFVNRLKNLKWNFLGQCVAGWKKNWSRL